MRKIWQSRSWKIGGALLMFAVLLIFCMGAFQYMLAKVLHRETEDKLSAVLTQSQQRINQNIQQEYRYLEMMGILIGMDSGADNAAIDQLIAGNSWQTGISNLGAVTVSGKAIYGAAPPEGMQKALQRSFQGERQITFLPGEAAKKRTDSFFLSVPIWRSGKVAGAMYGLLSAETFDRLASGTLFDESGIFFSTSGDFQRIFLQPGYLELQESAQDFLLASGQDQQDFLDYLHYTGKSLVHTELAGRDYDLALIALPEIDGWYVGGIVPSEVLNRYSKTVKLTALGTYAAFSFVFLLGFYMIVRIQRKNEAHVRQLAYTDELTGLSNWPGMLLLKEKLVLPGWSLAVLDIREFSEINEFMGHAYGSKLLKVIAEVLKKNMSDPAEMVCRVNGDRFAMYLKEQDLLVTRMRGIMQVIRVEARSYPVHMDCGIRRLQVGDSLTQAMGDAVTAMKLAKKEKQDSIFFYDEQMGLQNNQDKQLMQEIGRALRCQEMVVYLQPKYSLRHNCWCGSEALVRWKHPQKGILPPVCFIEQMEADGTIDQLDCYMLEAVCRQIRSWLDNGRQVLPVSVNISRVHFANASLVPDILAIVKKYGIPASLLELEVTESAFFKQDEIIVNKLERLHEAGFQLSIDDFGVGYSTLAALEKIPASILKLDKSFVDNWQKHPQSQLVADIVRIARHIGMMVVVEGVETSEQCDWVRKAGCDTVQGWYYAKPMSIKDYEDLVYGGSCNEKARD